MRGYTGHHEAHTPKSAMVMSEQDMREVRRQRPEEMRYVDEHRAEIEGKVVALRGYGIAASGSSVEDVVKQSLAQGNRDIFVYYAAPGDPL